MVESTGTCSVSSPFSVDILGAHPQLRASLSWTSLLRTCSCRPFRKEGVTRGSKPPRGRVKAVNHLKGSGKVSNDSQLSRGEKKRYLTAVNCLKYSTGMIA